MLYDPKAARRSKRRLNAAKRIEQIDRIISELDGTATGSAGWCRGNYHTLVECQWDGGKEIKVKHCLVGAIELHVPMPRAAFYRMLGRQLPGYRPRQALILFNDEQDTVKPVIALLLKARVRQAKLAGMCCEPGI